MSMTFKSDHNKTHWAKKCYKNNENFYDGNKCFFHEDGIQNGYYRHFGALNYFIALKWLVLLMGSPKTCCT